MRATRTLGDGLAIHSYVTLARFFAENISMQAGSVERAGMDGTDADAVCWRKVCLVS